MVFLLQPSHPSLAGKCISSKGKTMATVAKERPVSLKFYLTPVNKSTNNIVRAAAQIMLDGMAAQKAG